MNLAKNISASLIVCVAAGAFAAGALFVEPNDSSSPSLARVAPGPGVAAAPSARYGTDGNAPSTNTGAPAATIEISGFKIAAARVAPGARVTVHNRDDTQHTLTARDESFSTGKIDGGSSVTFVAPRAPGKYTVFCEIHPSMRSTLTVG